MIVLFRPGTSHIVRGITCEQKLVEPKKLKSSLENSWYLTLEECYPEEKEEVKEVPEKKVILKEVKK